MPNIVGRKNLVVSFIRKNTQVEQFFHLPPKKIKALSIGMLQDSEGWWCYPGVNVIWEVVLESWVLHSEV